MSTIDDAYRDLIQQLHDEQAGCIRHEGEGPWATTVFRYPPELDDTPINRLRYKRKAEADREQGVTHPTFDEARRDAYLDWLHPSRKHIVTLHTNDVHPLIREQVWGEHTILAEHLPYRDYVRRLISKFALVQVQQEETYAVQTKQAA